MKYTYILTGNELSKDKSGQQQENIVWVWIKPRHLSRKYKYYKAGRSHVA